MKFSNFTRSSYTGRSIISASERTCNWLCETVETPAAEATYTLYRTPGTLTFVDTETNIYRGGIELNGRCFVVFGVTLFEISALGVATSRGTVATDGLLCSFALNPDQLMVVSSGYGYILTLSSNGFAIISSGGFPSGTAGGCAFIDGYFVTFERDSQQFQISALNDGTTWDALDKSSAESSPDFIVAIAVNNEELWVYGSQTTQPFSNSGTDFPFQSNQSAVIQQGLQAHDSVANLDNTLFWLGKDGTGGGIVMRARGYTAQRISKFNVEAAIASYGDVTDAEGMCFSMSGHLMYRITFPSANSGRGATWQLDSSNNEWTEVSWWNADEAFEEKHRCRGFVSAFGKILGGDWENGKLYQMSMDYLDDDGDVIRRVRRAPHVIKEKKQGFFRRLWFNGNTGIGLDVDSDTLGYNPQMLLQWSFDGGRTYGNIRSITWGKQGEYRTIPQSFNLGSGRDIVVETVVTDPVDWAIVDAYLDIDFGKN